MVGGHLFYSIWIGTRVKIIVSSVCFYFPVTLIGAGCIVLIARKILQGRLKKTSVIYNVVQSRRAALDFEKAIRLNSRVCLIIATICLAGTAGAVWNSGLHWGDMLGVVVITVLAVVSYICYIKSFRNNKVYKDTASLLRQINAMADGELNAPAIEDEESLL